MVLSHATGVQFPVTVLKRELKIVSNEKICSRCQIQRDINQFGLHPNGKDGRRTICNKCRCLDAKRNRDNNPELRQRLLDGGKARAALRRIEVIKFLGSKCVKCGFDDERALQVDHVNSDGFKDKNISASKRFARIQETPERYQLLCANCNWIKRVEKEEHSWRFR